MRGGGNGWEQLGAREPNTRGVGRAVGISIVLNGGRMMGVDILMGRGSGGRGWNESSGQLRRQGLSEQSELPRL